MWKWAKSPPNPPPSLYPNWQIYFPSFPASCLSSLSNVHFASGCSWTQTLHLSISQSLSTWIIFLKPAMARENIFSAKRTHQNNMLKVSKFLSERQINMQGGNTYFNTFPWIIKSLRMEKTSRMIKSNHHPSTAVLTTKPCPQVPHPHPGFGHFHVKGHWGEWRLREAVPRSQILCHFERRGSKGKLL